MKTFAVALSCLALAATQAEASMKDRIISGESANSRITACGVALAGAQMVTLRPFIETSASDLAGKFRINVIKRSRSGSAMVSQSNSFSGGSLGNVVLSVDAPSTLAIDMEVTDAAGTLLCKVNRSVDLDGAMDL